MILTCHYCNHSFETAGHDWPGDAVTCPSCRMEIRRPKAETVKYDTTTPLMELSPGSGGEVRPVRLADDEILPPGALLGQYRIERFIGKGGMGAVYKARHAMLQRDVALKVLPPKFAKDPEFVGRFQREALALANLSHPNIVAVHDMGTQGEISFFTMEYVDGVNLRDLLASKKLPPDQAIKLVPQLCEALEYAHSKNIIHRDIKPENIILDRSGVVKIADFGLAKIVKGDTAAVPLTQTNVIMGTVEYMAPEQRDSLKSVDHRADIYSLGVVLYEMLTGELPVGRFDMPSRRLAIDVRIDDVVLKALEREPGRRYQRASHMGTDVTQVIVRGAPAAPAPSPDLPVVDLRTHKAVGTAVRGRLAIRPGRAPLAIVGGPRADIGIESDGRCSFSAEGAVPLLAGDSATGRMIVFVPPGIDLDVNAESAPVSVTGVRGSLSLQGADHAVALKDFEGRLQVSTRNGEIAVSALRSEDGDLRTSGGAIRVAGLTFIRGRFAAESAFGDLEVVAAPGGSFRYHAYSHNESVVAPDGMGEQSTAEGTVGAGLGQMSLRSTNGKVALRLEGAPAKGMSVRSFLASITPKQKEQLGIFVIVNALLWVIAGGGAAALVAAVWGMALAIELWKCYVRASQGLPPVAPARMTAVVAAVAPGAAPVPRPEAVTSWWAVLSLLSALITTPLAIILCFWAFSLTTDEWGINGGPYWIVLASLSFATALLGAVTLAIGSAAGGLVRESKGALKGTGFASTATAVGFLALALVFWGARPKLLGVAEHGAELRETGERFIRAVHQNRSQDLYPLVELRSQSDGELKKRLDGLLAQPAFRAGVRVSAWGVDERRRSGYIELQAVQQSMEPLVLKLRRSGDEWRFADREMVKSLTEYEHEWR